MNCAIGRGWYRATGSLIPLLALIACQPQPASSPTGGPASEAPRISVPARPADWRLDVLTPTGVSVTAGTVLVFSAVRGEWSVGVGVVGPQGRRDFCECPVAEPVGSGFMGPLGALIGRIGPDGTPFFIGAGAEVRADAQGTLFLGANDNMGPCDQRTRGSCYADNFGSVEVQVAIR